MGEQGRIQGGATGAAAPPSGNLTPRKAIKIMIFHLKIRAVFSLMSSEKCHITIFARPPP